MSETRNYLFYKYSIYHKVGDSEFSAILYPLNSVENGVDLGVIEHEQP